eukprot:m.211955 g.211955  ORF g.211955 m.211955 type:complete len:418 (+) comp15068_c1_seq5:123-1376(+)
MLRVSPNKTMFACYRAIATATKSCCVRVQRRMSNVVKPIVLGIESTFDDSGIAIVDGNGQLLGQHKISQQNEHVETGGTVPLLARELHERNLPIALDFALKDAQLTLQDVDTIALALGPGLAPCLHAGRSFTQSLVHQHNVPVMAVHHMEAHALMPRMLTDVPFPFMVLLASGGHCLLHIVDGVGKSRKLGHHLDTSPGNCFEKVARKLGLQGGGAALESLAQKGDETRFNFTVPLTRLRSCDFSFTGLRSLVESTIDQHLDPQPQQQLKEAPIVELANAETAQLKADIAASFQRTAVRHLVDRCYRAFEFARQTNVPLSSFVVSGGVACNQYLRQKLAHLCDEQQIQLVIPPMEHCTDNGIMIAWAGLEMVRQGMPPIQDIDTVRFIPQWPLGIDIRDQVEACDIAIAGATRHLFY